MGGQKQENINKNLLAPEALIDFVEELRHAGFNIGMSEYIAAQDLLLMLTSRGENLNDPQRVSSLFGPLLCSSPTEQDTFPEFFRRWYERQKAKLSAQETPHEETMAEILEDTARRGLRWEWIMFALGVIVLVLAAWFVSRNFVPSEIQPSVIPNPPDNTSDALPLIQLASVALGLLGVAYFAWWAWWRRTANQFLQRRQSQETPDIQRISLTASDDALFPSLTFLSLARLFRQRVQVVSKDLNVVATVESSVENGGWLNPVYDQLLIPPEYLLLIDRRSRFDHLAEFVDGMVKRLEEHGVFLTAYAFDSDPRLCFPLRGNDAPQSLNELATRYENMRLIVFTDAQGLLSPTSGRLSPWTRLFNRWVHRSVLTPESPDNWGVTEYELQREFTVLPGTAEGLATFMHIIQGQEKLGEIIKLADSALPEVLQERPHRWLEKDALPASQIDSLLEDLKSYLGEDGYTWLKACAVYPELQWQITITLGQLLKDREGNHILNSKRLIDLARLPWFRYGVMPDWLRTRLVLDLEPGQEEEIRTVLEALLVTAVQGHGESLDLEVAYERRDWTSRLARPLLRLLQQESSSESPVQDHVFLDFMLQRMNLAVRVPENLRQQLFTRIGYEFGWKILLRWVFANVLAMFPYILLEVISESAGLDVLAQLLISLMIGPLVGFVQWLVVRRYWNIKALSWIGVVSLGLSVSSVFLIFFELVDNSGPLIYGTELGLINLTVVGLLQARLIARQQVKSPTLWWMGGLGIGMINTLLSFLFINDDAISYADFGYLFFFIMATILYSLLSGWIIIFSLRSRKLSDVTMIRPYWIVLHIVGFIIGITFGIILLFGVFTYIQPPDQTTPVITVLIIFLLAILIAIVYLPIPLVQRYFLRKFLFPHPELWFWSTLLAPVLVLLIIISVAYFGDQNAYLRNLDLNNINQDLLWLIVAGVIGLTTGFAQGLVWQKSGISPYYVLVWLLINIIGWSMAFAGPIFLDLSNLSPITWDQMVVIILTLTVLPLGLITSLPLPLFLRATSHHKRIFGGS